jgi:hypothetical protein
MSRYQRRALPRNYHPDLFDWSSERELRAMNRAARMLAQRYRISIRHAALLASTAGLGEVPR